MTRQQPVVSTDDFNARTEAFVATHGGCSDTTLIGNVRTRVEVIHSGALQLPVTVTTPHRGNSWVCSPQTTYDAYAREEIVRLGHPLMTAPLRGLVRTLGRILQHARIDRHVAMNNWLVSTNCYPALAAADIGATIHQAEARWPGHSIWWRSLNTIHHADWLAALEAAGALLLPSRQVYLYENIAALARRHANLKRDFAMMLAARDGIHCKPLVPARASYPRMQALYDALYLTKYSALNPQYTAALLRHWHVRGLLEMFGLHDHENTLQGVVGLFRFGNLVTAPIVGYNTALPQRLALYRRLMACVLHEAATHRRLVNLSAGADHFKRLRGGVPAIEYSAVFVNHLPRRRQRALRMLARVTSWLGPSVMRRLKR